jgi:hypothetical protein
MNLERRRRKKGAGKTMSAVFGMLLGNLNIIFNITTFITSKRRELIIKTCVKLLSFFPLKFTFLCADVCTHKGGEDGDKAIILKLTRGQRHIKTRIEVLEERVAMVIEEERVVAQGRHGNWNLRPSTACPRQTTGSRTRTRRTPTTSTICMPTCPCSTR